MLTLTPEQFIQMLKQKEKEIAHLINTELPEIVGVMAVNHFKLNFENEAWGRKKWKDVKSGWTRQGVSSDHKILTNSGDLGRSIQYKPESGRVIIHSDLIYAAVHNWGGIQYVKPHHRGRDESKKGGYQVRGYSYKMPQRQFIGEDEELNQKIKAKIEERLNKIFSK